VFEAAIHSAVNLFTTWSSRFDNEHTFCQVCPEGDLRRVQELIKRSPPYVQETNKNGTGRIPLHEANKNFNKHTTIPRSRLKDCLLQ
jgi:hypothetical protein